LLDAPLNQEAEAVRELFATEAFAITSAAYQLIATIASPFMYTTSISLGVHSSTALSVVEATHVAEILCEAGPDGMHVKDIAIENGVDQAKLGRILRLLATQHYFTEVAPDVFANNRHSSVLDTGKSIGEIKRS